MLDEAGLYWCIPIYYGLMSCLTSMVLLGFKDKNITVLKATKIFVIISTIFYIKVLFIHNFYL